MGRQPSCLSPAPAPTPASLGAKPALSGTQTQEGYFPPASQQALDLWAKRLLLPEEWESGQAGEPGSGGPPSLVFPIFRVAGHNSASTFSG